MPRDNESLIDIERAVRRILRYTDNVSRTELEMNDEKVSAILYQIAVIGEATKRLSQEFRQQHPEIPWRDIAGMQDVLIHKYDQVDFDVIWDVLQNKLPELLTLLEPLLPSNLAPDDVYPSQNRPQD
jgi:uncharacterized protein with HEPN domain